MWLDGTAAALTWSGGLILAVRCAVKMFLCVCACQLCSNWNISSQKEPLCFPVLVSSFGGTNWFVGKRLRVFASVSQPVRVWDMEQFLFPLEKLSIPSGLSRRHFAMARRQSAKCRDTELTRGGKSSLDCLHCFALILCLSKLLENKVTKSSSFFYFRPLFQ